MWIQYCLVGVRNLDTIEKKYYGIETDVKMHKLIMTQWQELIKHNEYLGVKPEEISVLLRWTISHSLGRRIDIKTGMSIGIVYQMKQLKKQCYLLVNIMKK